jgi:flagellar hook-length control protein FliK
MNVDGANSVSTLSSKSAIAGEPQALPDDGSIPEDFANALDDQKKLLREAKSQAEAPESVQTAEPAQTAAEAPKNTETQADLVALLEKYLPASPAESMAAESSDIDAALLALTTEPAPAENPSLAPETAADASSAMALTGLAFVKPAPDETQMNPDVEDMTTMDFLQKTAAFRQPAQKGQDFGLANLGSGESSSQSSSAEKQSFLSTLEKAMPNTATDMLPANRPVDARVEITTIARPISHPNWGKDLGEQIIWMNNKDLSAAEIRLNPEHLGPISVRIDVNKEQQASIMFTAQHLEVKEAIEASIPKLREMLVNQQLNLVNVNISQNSAQDQGKPQPGLFRSISQTGEPGIEDVAGIEGLGHTTMGKGLLNLYA